MNKPYYEDKEAGITIYCGDCREILPQLDVKVDLVLTSPPYDDLRNYDNPNFEFESISRAIFDRLGEGSVLVWVVNDSTIDGSKSCSSFKQALHFRSLGLNLHDTMIYSKNGPSYPSKDKYYQVFEYMFIFSLGRPKTINLLSDRPNRWYKQKFSNIRSRRNVKGELKIETWNSDEGGQYGVRFNIWNYNVGYGYSSDDEIAYQHPAIFPIQLARDHILSWTSQQDIVLDPMMGSGTTLKACKSLNRHAIGIDISEKYCAIAVERLRQSVMKLEC